MFFLSFFRFCWLAVHKTCVTSCLTTAIAKPITMWKLWPTYDRGLSLLVITLQFCVYIHIPFSWWQCMTGIRFFFFVFFFIFYSLSLLVIFFYSFCSPHRVSLSSGLFISHVLHDSLRSIHQRSFQNMYFFGVTFSSYFFFCLVRQGM